ncbi:uncharacterized protein LOC144864114 isoform X2 [Branchiostoma floridae x Branchiostoma japonicum]
MDLRWACLTLFLVLLANTARGQGCGLSAFRHVPETHCRGDELVVDEPKVGSVDACAKACCGNPACKSFQYSTYGDCYLISKICTDEEKETVSIGNMYDRIQGCGLSAFRHVPQTHCEGYENLVDQPQVGSADACAKACCDNPACKSFQFSIHKTCLLINKICPDEEKMSTPIGNMYDRIQASKRMVEARETLQDLRDVLLDLEEVAEIEQETRELEDMGEDVDMAEDAEKEVRELEEIEENAGMAEDDE